MVTKKSKDKKIILPGIPKKMLKKKRKIRDTTFDRTEHWRKTIAPFSMKPGETLNPAGRPKHTNSISFYMKRYQECPASDLPAAAELCRNLGVDPAKYTIGQAMAMHNMAQSFNLSKADWLNIQLDRTEGKPIQTTNINGLQANVCQLLTAAMASPDMQILPGDEDDA
jgi:hypothetical protein